MKSNSEIKSFESENEARILLEESRKRIDEIDNALFDLISQRTSLAKDIALSKEYLGMPVYDENREKEVHRKIEKFAEDNNLDVDVIDQIVNLLTILNKNEQKEILRRNVNGQY
ncbi:MULTISPECIES: chorismate mutase [Methanobrevibacter]|uniref:Chorismate mutase n=1 Tax=Methanobrevibacter thaueri TaxID=190975 RepID=A0A315XM46_9EURY|nr:MULTISPECIES: chorismate mutase [Methanobrevibacter]MBR2665101.1 chorismate mutase [Methanobrevibacter sp.]MBR3197265.1 chorismate mutase [Methanobrevibacter sp.]MBR6927588.1 chorismate mutase [Methanobrevibacter sp.]PWB86806.1 chorismate mutase [Methanobrevibacter thaueri]